MPAKAIEQNGVLVLPNANRNDQGSYVCTGSDMLEEDTAQVILIVEEGMYNNSIDKDGFISLEFDTQKSQICVNTFFSDRKVFQNLIKVV